MKRFLPAPIAIAARLASVLCLVGALVFARAAHADDDPRIPAEDRVVRLTLPLDGEQVTGKITSYDTILFTLETDEGTQHRVLWNMLPGENVDRYWRFIEQPEGDAEKLFELGDLLIRHSQGKALAEQAFNAALAIDPNLADQIKQSRKGFAPDGSPRYVGTADPQKWGELPAEMMEAGVRSLHAFSQRTQDELGVDLSLYESERFIVLTNAEPEQVTAMSAKLNQAYRTTAALLGDDPDGNIFLGKCLVVLLTKRVDYIRFQKIMHDTDARGTGGLCHGFGDGHTHIALYSRSNPRQTHHVLVHEFVHAYLHRHRSPVPLVDWVNEGLAEHLAHEIEPAPGSSLYIKSRLELEGKKGLGEGFFDGDDLAAWQYDVAGALTGYLLTRGEHAYPKFIEAMKDGQTPEASLKTVYKMTPAVLTQRFKRKLDRELNEKLGG